MASRFAVLLTLVAASILSAQVLRSQTPAQGAKIVEIGPGKNVVLPEPTAHPQGKPPKVTGWPAGRTPTAAPGFRVTQFADNLQFPRWIYVLPNGDVLVSEAGGGENRSEERRVGKECRL